MKRKQKIYLEGNNGGDYLKIEQKEGEMMLLEVGSCCVASIAKTLPVQVVTAALTEWILKHNNDIEQAIKSQGWKPEYAEQLIKLVKEANA